MTKDEIIAQPARAHASGLVIRELRDQYANAGKYAKPALANLLCLARELARAANYMGKGSLHKKVRREATES